MEYLIKVENLKKKYHVKYAVNDISFNVEKGSIVGIFGKNGAGKTTLIKNLLGLTTPTSGAVNVLGVDPQKKRIWLRENIGYVPEQIFFHKNMKTKSIISLASSMYPNWDKEYEEKLVDLFELDIEKKVGDFSMGMVRQLSIILAFAHKPKLVFLDEPTANLDPVASSIVHSQIRYLAKEFSTAFFIATHLIPSIQDVINIFFFIDKGKIILNDSIHNVTENYAKIFVDNHSEKTNRFDDYTLKINNQSNKNYVITNNLTNWNQAYNTYDKYKIEKLDLLNLFLDAVQVTR